MSSLQPHLKTTPSRVYRPAIASPSVKTSRPQTQKISEATYWSEYYDKQEDEFGNPVSYEWNNGYLEIKPVSDQQTTLIHLWFLSLLQEYLRHYPCAKLTLLEMGSKFQLSDDKASIRKPDLGIVLNDNPVPYLSKDMSYKGCPDMCVETLSTSRPSEIKRDTIQKKREYQAAGVKEYLILAHDHQYCEYYQLDEQGVYQAAARDQDGVVRSGILPGFQWRMDDLYQHPDTETMMHIPIYQGFVALQHQKTAQRAKQTEQQVSQAIQRAEQAEQKLREMEQQNTELKALLAKQAD